MNLTEKDEYAHTPSTHPLWRESHYFNFYDGKQNVGGFTTIAVLPNKGLVEAGIAIVRDKKLIYAHPFEGTLKRRWNKLCFDGMKFEPIKPLKIWKIEFEDEDVGIELTFKGINPVFDYGKTLGMLTRVIGTRHYEHSGSVEGTIIIGDEYIPFSGLGERDHSWGIRDWHGCRRWTWFSVQFDSNLAFNCWYVVIGDKEFLRGYVYDGEKNSPIKNIDIQTVFEDDGKTQKTMRFELNDSKGRTFPIDAKALIVVPVLRVFEGKTSLLNEAFSEFKHHSKRGYGITEYLWTERCL